MNGWILLFFAVFFEVVATNFLKVSEGFTKVIPVVIVFVCYTLAFYLLSLSMKTLPIAVIYAAWSGIGIIFISITGYFFFQEKLDLYALLGILLILAGVLVLQLLSKSTAH